MPATRVVRAAHRNLAVAGLVLSVVMSSQHAPAAEIATVEDVEPASAAAGSASPSEQVLVVTGNLQEAYDASDVRDLGEMNVFVNRLLNSTPYDPDVLLLQEVRDTSARRVARVLSETTGSRYVVAVDPGSDPWEKVNGRTIHSDTGVVINTETMRALTDGGFITTSFARDEAAPGGVPETKKNAWTLLQERSSRLQLPISSVHFSLTSRMASVDIAESKKRDWSAKIAGFFKSKFPEAGWRSIGGDVNAGRCVRPTGDCEIAPFWAALTGSWWNYQDSIFSTVDIAGVDHVFTQGGTLQGFVDNYNPDAARGTSAYYSDHRFRWALLSPDGDAPTSPTNLRGTSGNLDIRLTWNASSDRETGILHYEIWRGQSSSDMRLRAITSNTSWLDTSTYRGMSYLYYVVAVDRAHHRSPRSSTARQAAFYD